MSAPFKPSPQQEAIFADIAEGEGHTIVESRAGVGKSTTILKGLEYLPDSVKHDTFLGAFNKSIAKHLQEQAPSGVVVSTLHSYGLRQLSGAMTKRPQIDEDKMVRILWDLIPERQKDVRAPARKLVGLAKGCLASKATSIDALIDAYEVNVPASIDREDFVNVAVRALDAALDDQTTIDFDDMIWFPCVLKMNVEQYARVFADESQDLSPAQAKLVLKACGDDGRIMVVGDSKQAIYQFRGADKSSIANFTRKLDAKTLKLTVSYRCARKIVELAQKVVPDFEAAPDAPEGIVRDSDIPHVLREASGGDFILSRTNAPLVRLCFQFLREGKRVAIQGRDIGARLRSIVTRSKATTIASLMTYVENWRAKEIARLDKLGRDVSIVIDTADCLQAISEDAVDVEELLGKIDRAFEDDAGGDRNKIVLSSTHRAKGLERDRVWMLRDTYLRGRRRGGGEHGEVYYDPPGEEENNIYYVAVTRARRELILVRGDALNGGL